jgi:hypothetical protein
MANYYDGLLELCGFEQGEIDEERPRIEETFKRLGIGPDDMEAADSWVRQNHEISLMGVRKLLGAWIKEMIDAVLARDEGKKPVYYGFPAILGPALVLSASSDDVFAAAPDVTLIHVMGQIFNKLSPIIEAGEANGAPPGHALCSIWQAKIGGLVKGIIPPPSLNISSGYFCDMSAVGDALVNYKYGTPSVNIDGSMDGMYGEYPKIREERVAFFGAQINNALKKAEKILDVRITPDAMEKGTQNVQEFRSRLARLIELMKADPVPLSLAALDHLEALPGASTARGIREGIKAMDILIPELEERVKAGIGAAKKGAPRVSMPHAHMSDPRCCNVMEDVGLAVPVTYVLVWMGGIPLRVDKVYPTIGENIAANELLSGMVFGGDASHERIVQTVKIMKLDGFIMKNLFNCRAVAGASRIEKKHLEEALGIPVLSLEEDLVDTRTYSADYVRSRVETYAEMLKARKAWEAADTYEDEAPPPAAAVTTSA